MRITIRNRILLLFVGVAFIQALLLGSFLLSQQSTLQRNQVNNQLKTVSDTISSQVDTFWNTIFRDLQMASQQVERMALKPYQQYNLLNNLKNSNPSIMGLAFYDLNGTIKSSISDTKDGSIPSSFHNTDLFTVPYDSGSPYILPLTSAQDELLLGISHPIYFLDHSYIIGVITALVRYDGMQEIVDRAILPSGQNVFILNSQGTVLAEKAQHDSGHRSFPVDRDWNGEFSIDGTVFITTSSSFKLDGQTLLVIAALDKETAMAPAAKTLFFLSLLILLLLLLALLVGLTTNRKIITPLQRLAHSSATLLQGKDIEEFSLPGDVELQDLAQNLNSMNQQLRESNATLKQEVLLRQQEEKKAIQARIDAEKTSQAKSIFLANMSHEIRTPLQGMLGLLELIGNGPLPSEQQKLLTMASVSGQRLQTLVNSILDLSQIESGKFQLHHSTFTLSSLLTEVIEMMQVHADEKNLLLKVSQETDIPDILQADSGRIRQILINLINNGIKYTDRGGVHLKVCLGSMPDDQEIVLLFSIKDSGRGISVGSRKSIFDPFEQGTMAPDKAIEGIGLGLAISAEFVHYMQGKLWLDKSDEKGSIFCFTIHCEKGEEFSPHPAEDTGAEVSKQRLANIRILLAEDEFINQRVISAYLEELGAAVGICENGQELLEKMEEKRADIILMDIRMPVLDGIEATKRIREREAGRMQGRIPIIALTAQATTEFEEKCKEAGMDGYLTKPIPFKDLTQMICDLHEQSGDHRTAAKS